MVRRRTSLLRGLPYLVMLAVTLVCTPTAAFAQLVQLTDTALLAPLPDCIPPGPGTAANFAIDGLPICVGAAEDWFSLGACTPVLLNSPFGAPNPQRVPAIFSRDSTSNSIGPLAADTDVFSGTSNKNDDLIGATQNPWTWGVGSTPPKDDLTEVYLHARTDINGHIWIILANAHRSTDGDKHTDYEFNTAGIAEIGNKLVGLGPDGGRTANKDFVITVDYINGGANACVGLRRWNGSAYDTISVPAGTSFSAVNQGTVPVPGDVMSTTSQYNVVRFYEPTQFVEAGIDITALLPDLNPTDLCKPTATVLVKTRSSQSFTAELKDFALIHFNVVQPPSVSTSNDGPGCVGGTIHLTSTVDPAGGTFSWTGPLGFTSSEQNPTLTPLTSGMAGKYYLTYSTTDGCTNLDSTTVVVNTASVDATNDGPKCVGATLGLSATGTPAGGTYAWTGPNGFTSTQQNPSITNVQLVNAGIYTVTYTSTAGCLATATTTAVINTASVTANNDGPKCVGTTLGLTSAGTPAGGTYAWTGPNGFSSTLQNPTIASVTLAAAGVYTVTYTSTAGCIATATTTVVIGTASVTANNNGPKCVGTALGLTSSGTPAGGTYAWTGPNGFSSTQQNPTIASVTLAGAGVYTVTYTSTAGCLATATTTVVVNSASVTANNDGPKCVGSTINLTSAGTPAGGTYAWTGPNGFSSALQNPSIVSATTAASGTYTVTYTSTAGCIATGTTSVTINTATTTAGNSGPVCVGQQLCLSASGTPAGGTYAWTGPNGFSSSQQNPCIANAQLVNGGTYTVTYTSTAGCIATNTTTAVVGAASVTANNDGPKCVGATLNLTSAGTPAGGTYAWTGPNGFSSTLQNPSIAGVTLAAAGLYTVTYTSPSGCIGTGTTTVVINTASVTANNNGPKCVGTTLGLTSSGTPAGGTYAWTGPNGFSSALQNPNIASVTLAAAGVYTVTYTSTAGCLATATTTVVINTASVTANNDGPKCVGATLNLTSAGTPAGGTYAWTGPNSFSSALQNPSIASVTLAAAGVYTVTYTSTAGCIATATTTVVIGSAGVVVSNDGPKCVGGTLHLTATGSPAGGTYAWTGPNSFTSTDQNPTIASVTLAAAGVYTVTYTSTAGCIGTGTTTVVINSATVTANNNGPKCVGQEVCLTSAGTPAGGTYAWTGPNGFTSTSQNPCIAAVTAAAAGEYTVTYTSGPGCTATNKTTVVVNPLPSCTLTAPDPLPQCASPANQLCAVVTNASTYLWTVTSSDGSWEITGDPTATCATYKAGNGGTTGVFKLVVTSEAGCKDSCTVEFTCISSQYFCTLTQGAYGNPNGMFNGMRRLALIQSLITPADPLVVGKLGARSLTFPDGAEQCIIDRLPAGGPAAALPAGIGNATINLASNCTNPLLTLQNGRFRNVFLGQVITLSLNSRLDENLSGLTICKTMVTVRAITGTDGKPAPDPTDTTGKTITLPARIFTALANLGLPKTVGGLLTLANLGLAGLPTDVATLGDLNTAVSAINEGFDECRFLVKCLDGETGPGVVGGSGEYVDEAAGIALPVEFGLSASMPNPFSHVTTIRLSLPERSSVQLSVYNILGQEVARLADGELSAGVQSVQWNAVSRSGDPVAPGVYFFRVRAHSLESGRAYSRTQKALFIK